MLKKILTALFVTGSIAVICYCGYQILTTVQDSALSDKEYVNIKDSYVSAIKKDDDTKKETKLEDVIKTEETDDGSDPKLNVDHKGLLDVNADYVGWIYYGDADMSYPITRASAENENYYLDHSFEGTEVNSGCIFIDSNADASFEDANTFVYGHNMASGQMMGSVKKVYETPSDYSDPYIYLYLKDGTKKVYRVFAIYVTDENDKKTYLIPRSEDVMTSYINRGLRLGTAYSKIGFADDESVLLKDGNAKLITLSTCYGRAGTTKRLIVHGILLN